MVYVFCAIKEEADCLKSFVSEDCTVVITGVGKINMAYSVGKVLGNKSRTDCSNDFVINFGCTCSKNLEGCFFVNKITDISSGRDFYPDMIRIPDSNEAHLFTSDLVVLNPDCDRLYDMEGSAFFESTSKHISPDRIFLIKCVSDSGSDKVSRDSIIKACESGVDYVRKIIDVYSPAKEVSLEFDERSKLYITSSIESQLNELVSFSNSLGININTIFKKYTDDKDTLNKRETMEVIDNVRQYLIS